VPHPFILDVKHLKISIDFPLKMSIIVSVKGQESRQRFRGYTPSLEKKSSKKFSKPLDNRHKLWYNKDTPKGVNQIAPKRAERGIL
jgi:hypothetical protein